MREVVPGGAPYDLLGARPRVRLEGHWSPVETQGAVALLLELPLERRQWGPVQLAPRLESATQLLALAADHVDTLLEDWYPALGTRFVHTSQGRFLVTRLVPCPLCAAAATPAPPTPTPTPAPPSSGPPSRTSTDSGVVDRWVFSCRVLPHVRLCCSGVKSVETWVDWNMVEVMKTAQRTGHKKREASTAESFVSPFLCPVHRAVFITSAQ